MGYSPWGYKTGVIQDIATEQQHTALSRILPGKRAPTVGNSGQNAHSKDRLGGDVLLIAWV